MDWKQTHHWDNSAWFFSMQLFMNIQAFTGQLSCARLCIFKSSITTFLKATSYWCLHGYNEIYMVLASTSTISPPAFSEKKQLCPKVLQTKIISSQCLPQHMKQLTLWRATWREGVTKWWGFKHRSMAFNVKSHGKHCIQAAENAGNCKPANPRRLKMHNVHIETCVTVLLLMRETTKTEGFL